MECISPRIGIKSSLPKHISAVVTVYILWLHNKKPFVFRYGETYSDTDDKTKLRFTDDEQQFISEFLEVEITELDGNPLVKSQIEPLQTGLLNLYKLCNFKFVDGRSAASERSGGERFEKEISLTSLIDSFDAFVNQNIDAFKGFAVKVLEDSDFKSSSFYDLFSEFWTPFTEQVIFKDEHDISHEHIFEVVNGSFELHENGPARIVKKFLSEGTHKYINSDWSPANEDEFSNYIKRARFLSNVLKANFCSDDNQGIVEGDEPEDIEDIETDKIILNANIVEHDVGIPKNILLKGVPGTGKSRLFDEIVEHNLLGSEALYDHRGKRVSRVLKINIHSNSSNSSLMQGVGVTTSNNNILYSEKYGLVLDLILKAIEYPKVPFALILEEVQENSLNSLIGDLIYLMEDSKRADLSGYIGTKGKDIFELIESITETENIHSVVIPTLIENDRQVERRLIFPSNLYLFCTTNYRNDKKIIEDNLLRRFTVLEIYPDEDAIADLDVRTFFSKLNDSILDNVDDIHNDRYLVGHANWLDVTDAVSFHRAFLKLIVDFKEIKEFDFSEFRGIFSGLPYPYGIDYDIESRRGYSDLVIEVQSKAQFNFL